MLFITQEQLELLLERYQGRLVSNNGLSSNQSSPFFADPKSVFEPQIQVTLQLDITDVYHNYKQNYEKFHGSSFSAFTQWIAIKAMHDSACTYRLINGKCFQFDNLPLELTIKTYDKRQQAVYYLDDVTYSTWNTFCKIFSHYARAPMQHDKAPKLPIDAIAYQIDEISSNIPQKGKNAHQPRIWFSERYNKEGKIFLPLHVSFSQATMTSELAQHFLQKFEEYARLRPSELEALFRPKKVYEQEMITDVINLDFLKQSKVYVPDYHSKSDNVMDHNTGVILQLTPTFKAKL